MAALNLGFYLASWGMYRGSSFLLQKDYKVHVGAVKIIQDERYGVLRGISLKDFTEEKIDLLFGLIEQLREYYNKIKSSVPHLGNNNDTTDTLITKALMGTLGCIPAYDRFFIKGINESAGLRVGLNKENFKALLEWCKNNPVPDNIRQDIPSEYPTMKIIDMHFWRIGEIKLTNDAINEANEELTGLNKLNSLDRRQTLRKTHLEQKLVRYKDILNGK